MTAYVFVDLDIHDKTGYSKYPPLVWPLIEKHGGKLTHRISEFEAIEGSWCPKRMVIIEFPDKAAARSFLADPEYAPVKDIRFKTANSLMVVGNSE